MKRIILSLLLSFCAFGGWAQSRFVSNTQMPVEDRATEDPSHKGVLVLSKNPDLLITVINDNDHTVVQRGKQQSGYYEYEVYINDPEMKAPKIDVSHRGDINHTTFMPRLKKGRLCAYLIDEVEKPITMENQTTKSDAILDEQGTLAEVEFTSTISNLKIMVSPKLQATIKQRQYNVKSHATFKMTRKCAYMLIYTAYSRHLIKCIFCYLFVTLPFDFIIYHS